MKADRESRRATTWEGRATALIDSPRFICNTLSDRPKGLSTRDPFRRILLQV
jgi:hypothetical protein